MLFAGTIRRYATASCTILHESEKTCNSTVSIDEVYLHHLAMTIVRKPSRVSFYFCHLTKTRKTFLPESHNCNEIFVRSMKRYSAEKFLEVLREIVFPNYLTYTCVNDAYSDFIFRFVGARNSIAPSKKNRVKATSKPWFDHQIVSAIQRRNKLYTKFKHSDLETDKDNFKVTKTHLHKIILDIKKSYFEEKPGKNKNKAK